MKKVFNLSLLLFFAVIAQAQTLTITLHSGPNSQYKAFRGSGLRAGTGWNLPTYNDGTWLAPVNGSVPDTSLGTSGCDGPNWSPFHAGDTAIWSDVTTHFPDTACFRKDLRFCGTVSAGTLNVLGDDYADTYINGHLVGTQSNAVSGETFILTPTQLTWFGPGNNVIAVEVRNVSPNCAAFSMYGSLTVDTAGCVYPAAVSDISWQDIQISPVPVRNHLHLSLPQNKGTYTFVVYNLVGQRLLEQTTTDTHTSIDMSDMPRGIYILHATDTNNNTLTRRIAKD